MSVLVPNFRIYRYIYTGLQFAAYNSTINDLYLPSIREGNFPGGDTEKECQRITKSWLTLNCLSYAARYNEKIQDDAPFLTFYAGQLPTEKPNACQLLKYLECVRYQIEETTIEDPFQEKPFARLTDQQKKDLTILESVISDLRKGIISQLSEYSTAKWAD